MAKKLIQAMAVLTVGLVIAGSAAWAADEKKPAAKKTMAMAAGPAVDEQTIHYDSLTVPIEAYEAKPKSPGKHPAILLVHDNFGLTDGTKAMAKSLAQAGYVVMAPNLISRLGDKAPRGGRGGPAGALNVAKTVSDVDAAYDVLAMDPGVDASKISAIGIGWGGWRTYKLAEDKPELYRLVTYYAVTPGDGMETMIKAPVLAHYAQGDFLTTASALKTAKWIPKFTYYIYPDSFRGFAGAGGAGGVDLAGAVGEGGEVAAASEAEKAAAAKTQDDSVAAGKQSMERTLAFLK